MIGSHARLSSAVDPVSSLSAAISKKQRKRSIFFLFAALSLAATRFLLRHNSFRYLH